MAEAEHGLADYDPRWERGTRSGRGDAFADRTRTASAASPSAPGVG